MALTATPEARACRVGEGGFFESGLDVVFRADTASLTLPVVPTDIDDVTKIVSDGPSNTGVEVGENTGVIVPVDVGDELLFGAPFTSTIDGTASEGRGNVTLKATFDDNTATEQVKTAASDVQISPATSADAPGGGSPCDAIFGAALFLVVVGAAEVAL